MLVARRLLHGLFLLLAGWSLAAPARAQRLVPVGDQTVTSLYRAFPPFIEEGALLAPCVDGTSPVLLRVDANSVQRLPGWSPGRPAGVGFVAAVACGGHRWLLEYDPGRPIGARSRYAVSSDGAAPVWSHVFAGGAFAPVDLRCAAGRALVGWEEQGELAIVVLEPNRERRARLWASGAGDVVWVARTPDELFAIYRPWTDETGIMSLVRIAQGAVTQRRDLRAIGNPALALAGDRVLVGWSTTPEPAVMLQSFKASDLSPAPAATIAPPHARRSVEVRALWPLPRGDVVVALDESWYGPDKLYSPLGRSRDEPARHWAAALHIWSPGANRVGPRFDLGSEDYSPSGGVVGRLFVLLQGGHRSGVIVRRFVVKP